MHDAYVIAVPTLAVIFSALLTHADTNALRREMHENFAAFRAEFRAELGGIRAELASESSSIRAELRSELSGIRADIVSIRERLARIEERIGIKTAVS